MDIWNWLWGIDLKAEEEVEKFIEEELEQVLAKMFAQIDFIYNKEQQIQRKIEKLQKEVKFCELISKELSTTKELWASFFLFHFLFALIFS